MAYASKHVLQYLMIRKAYSDDSGQTDLSLHCLHMLIAANGTKTYFYLAFEIITC